MIEADQLLTSTREFATRNSLFVQRVVEKAKAQSKAHVDLFVVGEELFDKAQHSFHDNPFVSSQFDRGVTPVLILPSSWKERLLFEINGRDLVRE